MGVSVQGIDGRRRVRAHRCFDPDFQSGPPKRCDCRFWPKADKAARLVRWGWAVRLADGAIAFRRRTRTAPFVAAETIAKSHIEALAGLRGAAAAERGEE